MRSVYLDNNATTPLDPRVREAMLPWLGQRWGNPSSIHRYGQAAREAVEEARSDVAALVGGRPEEIVFTASGSEANNALLWSVARQWDLTGHFVISALEHPSIQVTAQELARLGMEVTPLAPSPSGRVEPASVEEAMRPDTRLVCLMSANNEIGTLQPVAEVAALCRERDIPLHCDAVQSVGKVETGVDELGATSVTVGAHKFHGPLGAAALWLSSRLEYRPWLLGGGQERRRRASTENVPALVGFGAAARLARQELETRQETLRRLRDRFESAVGALADVRIHCRDVPRLPNTSHLSFQGLEGEALTIRLDLAGFAVSTGSACASGAVEPSPTLLAMGLSPAEALSSLRISFGMENTDSDVDRFVEALRAEVRALRSLAPSLGS